MASAQQAGLPRASVLRFDLLSVSLTGHPTNFKNPQLVLKTQNSPASRVPYTGSKSRHPVRRHFLMVHVKDKARELVSGEPFDLLS